MLLVDSALGILRLFLFARGDTREIVEGQKENFLCIQ